MKSYWEQVVEIDSSLPREEIRHLLAPSDFHGWLALAITYAVLASSFLLVWAWPSVLSVLVALVVIGGRQLALAILTHEAVHKSLFASRRVNEWVGRWLCASPMGISLDGYRKEHFEHHQKTGTSEDPDLGLVNPYPVSRKSMARKFARDLFGVTAVKRIYYIGLMGFGFITYTLSTNAKPVDQTGRSLLDVLRAGARNLGRTILTNLILLFGLTLMGVPLLYLLWVGAYFTTFSLFLRVRSIAEHACSPDRANALLNSRTTRAGLLSRFTVAPHNVNYHLEHHLFMQVPYFRLPALHAILKARGISTEKNSAKSYVEVIRLATTC